MNYLKRTKNWIILFLLLSSANTQASPLTGNATVASAPTAIGADTNPAFAAMLGRSEAGFSLAPFTSEVYDLRYPGYETVEKNSNGIDFASILGAKGGFVYKVNRRFGLGITSFVPPVPITVKVKDLPLFVLGQKNSIDAEINAKPKGGVTMVMGFEVSPIFALGFKLMIRSISADIIATESGKSQEAATISYEDTIFDVSTGILFHPSEKFSLGASVSIFSVAKQGIQVNVAGLDMSGEGGGLKTQSNLNVALSGLILGVGIRPTPQLLLLTDFEYRRGPRGQKDISLSELREKEKDAYDSFHFRGGVEIAVSASKKLLFGGQYEPSNLGPGGQGDGSKTGFGPLQAMLVYAGQAELMPYWAVAGGMSFDFGKLPDSKSLEEREESKKGKKKSRKREREREDPIHKWNITFGLRYQKASLGIDDDGDQPAAYAQTKISLPLMCSMRF